MVPKATSKGHCSPSSFLVELESVPSERSLVERCQDSDDPSPLTAASAPPAPLLRTEKPRRTLASISLRLRLPPPPSSLLAALPPLPPPHLEGRQRPAQRQPVRRPEVQCHHPQRVRFGGGGAGWRTRTRTSRRRGGGGSRRARRRRALPRSARDYERRQQRPQDESRPAAPPFRAKQELISMGRPGASPSSSAPAPATRLEPEVLDR